jgi:subtilisin family serine protease
MLDSQDHGTHVAQLVALNDPAIGIIAVRAMPITLAPAEMPTDIMDPAFKVMAAIKGIRQIEKGLEFAVAQGAAIVNMSLGLDLNELDPAGRAQVAAVIGESLIPNLSGRWSGTLMVCASGNEAAQLTDESQIVPAALPLPDLLSVGALKNHATIAKYSNQGRFVDVYVRGSNVSSALPGGRWGQLSGTSMAAPIVAHLAAQLKVIDPSLTPRELRALILNTADVRTLAVEDSETRATVRVLNMQSARRAARAMLKDQAKRNSLLKPPFAHGDAPLKLAP